jgi:hypothetical protein
LTDTAFAQSPGLQHFRLNNVAVLLKPSPQQANPSGILEKIKTYFVLALVGPETKSRSLGRNLPQTHAANLIRIFTF